MTRIQLEQRLRTPTTAESEKSYPAELFVFETEQSRVFSEQLDFDHRQRVVGREVALRVPASSPTSTHTVNRPSIFHVTSLCHDRRPLPGHEHSIPSSPAMLKVT